MSVVKTAVAWDQRFSNRKLCWFTNELTSIAFLVANVFVTAHTARNAVPGTVEFGIHLHFYEEIKKGSINEIE